MNKAILMGRLTRDPEVRYSQSNSGDGQMAIARYTLAVDRRFNRNGDQNADFIGCVAFGKSAEFAEKYLKQGTKIAVTGRIQTGSYTNKDGNKVYTTDVVIEEQEFAESKAASGQTSGGGYQPAGRPEPSNAGTEGFMSIPESISQREVRSFLEESQEHVLSIREQSQLLSRELDRLQYYHTFRINSYQ